MNSPEKLKRRSTSDNYATPSKRSRLSRTLCSSASTTNSPSMKSTVSSTKSPLKMISIVQYFTQPKEESWCPLCQMPFDILSATQSKQTHVMMCSENNFDDLEACHEGLTCRSKVRNHYQRFNHQELAAARDFNEQPCAGEFEKPSSPINDETVADSDQVISSPVNARPSSSCDVTNNRFVCFAGDSGSEASIVSVSPSTARNPAANETESRSENKTDDLNKTLNEPEDIFSSESSLPTTALTTKKESRHPPEEVNLPSEANTDEVNITDRAVSNTSALSELMKVTAVEKSNGLHIEVKMKQNFGLSEVHLDIPKSDSTSKVIDVVGKYRAQSSIQSFFKSVGGSNSKAKDDRNSLTKTEIADALKKGEPELNAGRFSNGLSCPFYKKILNSSYAVDAFNYGYIPGVTKYFLSHFHYDHYRGLSKHWSNFYVYCSPITARLLQMKLRVDPKWIRQLELEESYVIDNGVELRLLDANHCPGSVMFLFTFLRTGQVALHCGDFRACTKMEEYPALKNCSLTKLYLDTTYCKPEYDFPSQNDVISKTVELVTQHLKLYPKTLICVGSYTIGKERIFIALAEALSCKIFASTEKSRILKALQDKIVDSRLTTVASSAQIHVIDMGKIRNKNFLLSHVSTFSNALYDKVLSIVPTGWTHQGGAKGGVDKLKIRSFGPGLFLLEVPYSEHSSFSELRRFVQFLHIKSPDQIIPTVNVGNVESRNSMKKIFDEWINGPKYGGQLKINFTKK